MPRNPAWGRDELILALDLYLRDGLLDDQHPDVIELSHILNQLTANTVQPNADRYRNPNGVAMKLANFASIDPSYSGVALSRTSQLDVAIWKEFSTDRERLAAEAAQIRDRALIGSHSKPRRYWALNANPRIYDIEQAVKNLEIDTWTTKGRPVHAGDRLIIWKSQDGKGGRKGIVALGEVINEPVIFTDDDNPYWIDPTSARKAELRVEVRYVHPPLLPLWCGDATTSVLDELSVNGTRGTIFNVSSAQWAEVIQIAGGWPSAEFEEVPLPQEIAEVREIIAQTAGRRSRSQGFQSNPVVRQAIEKYAMARAMQHYEAEGWQVVDVSARASYDLHCRRPGGEELRVEVKGTKSEGYQILLTANEVEHARTHYPNVALTIVANILVTIEDGGNISTANGDLTTYQPWQIEDHQLKPLAYQYTSSKVGSHI